MALSSSGGWDVGTGANEVRGRLVVAAQVRTVVKAVELPRHRLPGKAHGVAQATGNDLALRTVGPQAQQGGVFGVGLKAVVAGGAHTQIQPAVWPHAQRAARVVAALGQVVQQATGRGQGAFALHVGHVQRPV